jgi:hypothetical protein
MSDNQLRKAPPKIINKQTRSTAPINGVVAISLNVTPAIHGKWYNSVNPFASLSPLDSWCNLSFEISTNRAHSTTFNPYESNNAF